MIARLALALALTVALATSTLTSELKGGYRDTCMVSFLYDHGEMYGKFAATCWTDAGNVHTYKGTTIDLNKCLVNRYGVLDWSPNGDAMETCECNSRRGETNIIDCACKTGHGSDTLMSSINMDEGIYATSDGRLGCFDIAGARTGD